MYNIYPYAVKALIQHEFEIDHLNIWMTFANAMDIRYKPDNSLWIVTVDGTEKTVTASAWTDEWTLRLTVHYIESNPSRVLVQYDGPDENLIIKCKKQWEPWGEILSQDISS